MKTIILFLLFIPAGIMGQVADDFSDGDFTQDPPWTGDAGHFKVSSSSAVPAEQRPALQLDAPGAGTSILAVAHAFTGQLEWRFWAKLSLNSSSGNFARIYLLSDHSDLKSALEGYYLQVGGAEDSVLFCRQDSLVSIRLLRLKTAFTGNSTNALRIRVTRSDTGHWSFYADSVGGQSLSFQGETTDLDFPGGAYSGFYCQYTASNTTKFYFDDFYAGPLIVDTIPPVLLQADIVSPSELILKFSEAVDAAIAEDTARYELVPGFGNPYSVVRMLDPCLVYLFFEKEMENGAEYTLTVGTVKDLAGNSSSPVSLPVRYYVMQPYDLIITEIMADPSPPRSLPEYEYLELFNRSIYPLNIEGLILKISASDHALPGYELSPGAYLLLCDDDALEIMQHVAPAIGIPSLSLSNSGATIELNDTTGRPVCFLEYDLSSYRDNAKSEGGWSLEMIDPENPCRCVDNWTASVHADGGTPGAINSVTAQQVKMLSITGACCTGEREVLVKFSESLDSLNASDTLLYFATPFTGHPLSATPLPPAFNTVGLAFRENFQAGLVYELRVGPSLQNCVGNELSNEIPVSFSPDQPPLPFDIIINEILFNPLGDGVDYAEIYNRSEKAIDLENLLLCSVKQTPPEPPDTQRIDISASCRVLFPGEYLALTSDPEMVKSQYMTEDPVAFLEMESFPSYNNDLGMVLLTAKDGQVIDGMSYSEEMHFLMLLSYEGVSLERISPERPGNDPSNWHSAAETSGYGTPGYRNSQYLAVRPDEASLSVQPEIFSPDGDGRDDNMGIVYRFDQPGKLVTVLIFNADGRLARTLVNNEMPGTEGVFSWDGTLDDRTPAQNGIYIVFMEALGMDGKTRHFKKAGVLARNR